MPKPRFEQDDIVLFMTEEARTEYVVTVARETFDPEDPFLTTQEAWLEATWEQTHLWETEVIPQVEGQVPLKVYALGWVRE